MAVGCKIIRDFPRPARELVERFRGVATSNLVDVMGSCAAIDGALAPIGCGRLLGTAFPVRLPQGDNLMLHAAIDLAQPGDVLVIDAGGFFGACRSRRADGKLLRNARHRGIVCDGAIRDSGRACADGRFSGLCAQRDAERSDESRTWRNWRSGRRGRKVGAAGDIVAADEDGVVVVPMERADAVADAAHALQEKEEKILHRILQDGVFDRPWLNAGKRSAARLPRADIFHTSYTRPVQAFPEPGGCFGMFVGGRRPDQKAAQALQNAGAVIFMLGFEPD